MPSMDQSHLIWFGNEHDDDGVKKKKKLIKYLVRTPDA